MLLDEGFTSNGVYTIYPFGLGNSSMRVFCDMTSASGGWTVFQRRRDGSVDFNRNWADYGAGFGDLSGEFWLGNDNLVTLTSDDSRGKWELRVDLEDWQGNTAWASYSDFKITGGRYTLNIGKYEPDSTAGDSLGENRGFPFSTKDRDNDDARVNCALGREGAWWYDWCSTAQLTGRYYLSEPDQSYRGISWGSWKGDHYSLKQASMKIREIY